MAVGPGDPRRARIGASDHERARALATVRRFGADGLLSGREVEDRIEQVFRAKTLSELDSVVSSLPRSPHIAAEMMLAHGFGFASGKPEAPWWRGILVWSLGLDVLWVIVWLVTGGAFGWLALAIVSTTIAFTVRFVSRHRRHFGAKQPARRRRMP